MPCFLTFCHLLQKTPRRGSGVSGESAWNERPMAMKMRKGGKKSVRRKIRVRNFMPSR